MNAEHAALAARIRQVLQDVERVVSRAEYRGFRHLVRNVYTFNLRPSRLKELTLELRACYEATQRDLTNFIVFLDSLAQTD